LRPPARCGTIGAAVSQQRIAFFNRFFETWPDVRLLGAEAAGCFVFGPHQAAAADAVVFHLPTLGSLDDLGKPPGQLWVAWSLESRVTCPRLSDQAFMARFDLTMTYERASDVWFPYFGPGTVPYLLREPGPKTAPSPVVHLQSNPYDESGRNRFAFELMRRVKVDSYGDVLRNRPERIPPGWGPRVDVMRRYKFTLALENSIAPDYVSDKFFDALAAGSVPVYRGAPDVADLAPSPGSYIDAADFASPADLAEHLNRVAGDDRAYARYHAWRARGFAPAFAEHLRRLREPPLARLARLVGDRLERGAACP
jgi:alpha-1,3-fucosyltransferase 10